MARPNRGQRIPSTKTCKQVTGLVSDYLNDKLAPAVKRDFQHHLRLCPDCVSFLNTYKKSVSVTRSIRPEEIPPRIRDNIVNFLRARVGKSGRPS
jgi:hypothetical protein